MWAGHFTNKEKTRFEMRDCKLLEIQMALYVDLDTESHLHDGSYSVHIKISG